MALPKPAFAIPREICSGTSELPSKPGATIHHTFAQGSSNPNCLVVFLNGLMADKASWLAVMAGLIRSPKAINYGIPSMLAYDRFGQGVTEDRDPLERGKEYGHGHDVADAVVDLHELISRISFEQLSVTASQLRILFVANSIGCAIARLYAQQRPGVVVGLLLLDSIMANSNFDWWPNPDLDGFNPEVDLPADVSVEVLREQRAKFAASFHPDIVNREGLSRRNLAQLLPHSDGPRLVGPDGRGPWVTVMGHDFEKFADESLKVCDFTFKSCTKSCYESNDLWLDHGNPDILVHAIYESHLARIQCRSCKNHGFRAQ